MQCCGRVITSFRMNIHVAIKITYDMDSKNRVLLIISIALSIKLKEWNT